MGATEISVSRWKIALYLAISLGFVAIALLMVQHPDEEVWKAQLGLGFFGLCSLIFAWLLIRPQRLVLDSQGFTLEGGLVRNPKKVYWRDIDEFLVYRLPRAGKMIGYNYKPGVRQDSALARITRKFGADAALPKGWPMSPEKMVAELNTWRLQAAGVAGARPQTSGFSPGASSSFGRRPTVTR